MAGGACNGSGKAEEWRAAARAAGSVEIHSAEHVRVRRTQRGVKNCRARRTQRGVKIYASEIPKNTAVASTTCNSSPENTTM